MGGSVSVPHYEPWFVANWAYRRVMTRLRDKLDNPADVEIVEQAMYMHGLHFDLEPKQNGIRIARALSVVCDELRAEILATSDDPRDLSLAHYLPELEMRLHDIFEE